jgi:hypothetical protein
MENHSTAGISQLSFTQLFSVALILFSALLIAAKIFAWTGPTAAPPGNNVAAPINVGIVNQIKNASLGLNGLAVFGNTLLGGTGGSNAYLNFGASAGSSGYGFRDNGGNMEYKNSGGSWQGFGGGGGGGGGGFAETHHFVGAYCGGSNTCYSFCPQGEGVSSGGCFSNRAYGLQGSKAVVYDQPSASGNSVGEGPSAYEGWQCIYSGDPPTDIEAQADCVPR